MPLWRVMQQERFLIGKLGMKTLSKGVKSRRVGKELLLVCMNLNLKYGYSIREISGKVQEKVERLRLRI